MFIANFMAFVLSCETIVSIRVLGIVYKFFSTNIVVLCVLLALIMLNVQGHWMLFHVCIKK
jgi:hypothetical protein